MNDQLIYSVISIIGKLGSPVQSETLLDLLPKKMNSNEFKKSIDNLANSGKVTLEEDLLFDREIEYEKLNTINISRQLYTNNKNYLKLFSKLPGVRFLALTGSNAFESCNEKDDIDLFFIIAKDRLWIAYLLLSLIGKLTTKRSLFCANYLITEDHIKLSPQNYYSAVQFYKMKPLFNAHLKRNILLENQWIKENLPNADFTFKTEDFYRLRADFYKNDTSNKIMKFFNLKLFEFYKKRWQKKYPAFFGKSIIIAEGLAKLHRTDNSHIYQEVEPNR